MILHGTEKAVAKRWETAMTTQTVRHGILHLRVTPTALPLWHTNAHLHTHAHIHSLKPKTEKNIVS